MLLSSLRGTFDRRVYGGEFSPKHVVRMALECIHSKHRKAKYKCSV